MAQSPEQQFKPLFPFLPSSISSPFNRQEDQQEHISDQKYIRIRNLVVGCGFVTAISVIVVVIILVLSFTVYNAKEPEVKFNRVIIVNGKFGTGENVTLVADFTVKNTNDFTYTLRSPNSSVYYEGVQIGTGSAPGGKIKARRTIRVNSTMEIMSKKLDDIPSLQSDLSDQALNFSTYSRIVGKVKILNIFPKKVVIEINCTVGYNITTGVVTNGDNCLGNFDL